MADRKYIRLAHEGHAATLTIDRPERLNALDRELLEELGSALEEAAASDVRALVITGSGKAFVAGADISAMRDMSPGQASEFATLGHRTLESIERLRFPVIAAVNGFALGGGCELALACDFIYVSAKAKLGQPEVKLGVIPGFGGTQRLARRVGLGHARELIMTGRMIGAEEAVRIGLANRAYPAEELLTRALETARVIATMGPVAVAAAKRVLLDGADLSLGAANQLEIEAFSGCFDSTDQTEGMTAFLEKREPAFKGA